MLLAELKKQGIDISTRTFERDLVVVSKENNFVPDIAESTFSQEFQSMFDSLDMMMDACRERLDNPHLIVKDKMRAGKDGKPKLVRTIQTISP